MLLLPQNPASTSTTTAATAQVPDPLHLSPAQPVFGWVDQTALAVLAVFFVIGLFKGLIWQVSRIGILAVAYVVSGRYGHEVGAWLHGPATSSGAAPAGPTDTPETTLYLAYVLIFLAVLIALSLLALLLQRLAAKAGLTFFDRLGGGLFGVLTGAFVVLFGLFAVNMFLPDGKIAEAAQQSHSLRYGRQAIDWLGDHVDDELRQVLLLAPLSSQGANPPPAPGPAAHDGTSPAAPPPGETPTPPAPGTAPEPK